jgi:hypothetical protein
VIWLAVAVWILAAVLAVTNILAGMIFPGVFRAVEADAITGAILFATIGVVGLVYATAGMLILRQRVRHAVGWLLLLAGPLIMLVFASIAVGTVLLESGHPAAPWVILFGSYGWVPGILVAGPLLALVFPDGNLPGPRWRPGLQLIIGALAVALTILVLRPGPLGEEASAPDNPIGASFIPEWVYAFVEGSGLFVLLATLVIGVAAVVVRFRRARGDERQQLKWFTFAVVLWGVLLPPALFIDVDELFILAIGALVLVPLSVLVAIARYRLYEIDTLINRTLVYVPLVGIVAGLYAASVALFQRVFVAATGNTSDAAAIISALLLAAVFTPIRKAIEGIVDRRFKPAAADSAHVPSAPGQWEDPAFEAAVERVVRRVLRE